MRHIVLLHLTAMLLSGQVPERMCSMRFYVVDYLGRPQEYDVASFQDFRNREFADRFQGLRAAVPCSAIAYRFRLSRVGVNHFLTDLEGEVLANEAENWRSLVTNPNIVIVRGKPSEVSTALPPDYSLKGRLLPPPGRPLWIRLRSVYGSVTSEVESNPDGTFELRDSFVRGYYSLYVMNIDGQPLHSATLRITSFAPTGPLVINLGPEAIKPTEVK